MCETYTRRRKASIEEPHLKVDSMVVRANQIARRTGVITVNPSSYPYLSLPYFIISKSQVRVCRVGKSRGAEIVVLKYNAS